MSNNQNRALIRLFNQGVGQQFRTRLIDQGNEPLYPPADAQCPFHRIDFAHSFFSSALHELAHWTLAGEVRRQLPDYGYWYHPGGCDARQQAEFEREEVNPQAIEWALHLAAGRRFHVSVDNLGGTEVDRRAFQGRVQAQARRYLPQGFPPRGRALIDDVRCHYRTPVLTSQQFEF